MTAGRWFGVVVSALATLIAGYETAALLLPGVPTISRIIQGWRDDGHTTAVLALAITLSAVLLLFALWLLRHLLLSPRSDLARWLG